MMSKFFQSFVVAFLIFFLLIVLVGILGKIQTDSHSKAAETSQSKNNIDRHLLIFNNIYIGEPLFVVKHKMFSCGLMPSESDRECEIHYEFEHDSCHWSYVFVIDENRKIIQKTLEVRK